MKKRQIWSGLRTAFSGIFALSLFAGPVSAQDAACRQALVLALDVSGSVDMREFRLQTDGLVYALGTPAVRNALLSSPQAPVDLLIFEWSGIGDQHIMVPWMAVRSGADIDTIQEILRQSTRRASSRGTAIGEALEFAHTQLAQKTGCWRRTLDISGDGKANIGTKPEKVRGKFLQDGITINALVIGADAPSIGDLRQAEIGELTAYYQSRIIAGQGAFVQAALGYVEYGDAMARKLERELDSMVFSNRSEGSPLPSRLR